FFFFSSRRRHTRFSRDWSSDVCSSDLSFAAGINKRDGFFRDLGTGDRSNERDRWFARGQVLVDPGNGFRMRVIGDYDAIDENCRSEERRVRKECETRGWAEHQTKQADI